MGKYAYKKKKSTKNPILADDTSVSNDVKYNVYEAGLQAKAHVTKITINISTQNPPLGGSLPRSHLLRF